MVEYFFITIFIDAGGNYLSIQPPSQIPIDPTMKKQPTQVHAISLDELKKITKDFSSDTLIGKGSHARVFLGELNENRKSEVKMLYCPNFAVKELGKEFLSQVMSAYPACSNTLHMVLLVQICRKGLCSNFISCCRYSPSRDWSTTMLFNFLATVSRGTSVLLFMSTHRGAPCMIIFMVMKMKPLV